MKTNAMLDWGSVWVGDLHEVTRYLKQWKIGLEVMKVWLVEFLRLHWDFFWASLRGFSEAFLGFLCSLNS
jgi:hypothetical protein